MNAAFNITTGSILRTTEAFVDGIGQYFATGTTFEVVQVGEVNVRAQDQHGSRVWFPIGGILGAREWVCGVKPYTPGAPVLV